MALHRFLRHRLALLGLVILAVIAAISILAPLIAPTDPLKVDLAFFRKPPSPTHWLGTDSAGRDVLSRLIYAGQVSLTVGLVAALMSSGIGLILGSVAGAYGGWVDTLIMRLTDVVLSFPALVVIITLVALVGPSMVTIMLGIGLFFWPTACRMVRALALSLREQDFFLAARALGATRGHLIIRHLVPSVLSPLTVTATFARGAGDPAGGGAVVPGAGCAAAATVLGQHADRCAVAHHPGVDAVVVAAAGSGDRHYRAGDQLHWRRAARRARSAAAHVIDVNVLIGGSPRHVPAAEYGLDAARRELATHGVQVGLAASRTGGGYRQEVGNDVVLHAAGAGDGVQLWPVATLNPVQYLEWPARAGACAGWWSSWLAVLSGRAGLASARRGFSRHRAGAAGPLSAAGAGHALR